MIIYNPRSVLAIQNERDRDAFLEEKMKDGDVVKTIATLDKKIDGQNAAAASTVMEMSMMIDMQAKAMEAQNKAMEKTAMELTEMLGMLQMEIANAEGAE